jgi:fructokinase
MRKPQATPHEHLRFAVAAGAAACLAPGASPPALAQVEQLCGQISQQSGDAVS